MILKNLSIGALAVITSCLGAAAAQTQEGDAQAMHQAASTTTANPDHQFARKAAQGGMAEVKLGQLAQDKGQSDAVKDFGKRMVDDHSKANDELESTVAQENIRLPKNLSAHDQATYDRLSKLSGAEFDKAYARDMVMDHKKDIAEFKQEANNGQDPQIKNFASQTLPVLQDHLKMAQDMQQQVGAGSSGHTGAQ
jgi:putative membrane protein